MGTEDASRSYAGLDLWPTGDVVAAMCEGQLDAAAEKLQHPSGRLVYVGAGTSGRLAVLDGVELEPTFGWSRDRMIFGIAGGLDALAGSVEGAEDDEDSAREPVRSADLDRNDVVIGVAASGTTPFTVAAV